MSRGEELRGAFEIQGHQQVQADSQAWAEEGRFHVLGSGQRFWREPREREEKRNPKDVLGRSIKTGDEDDNEEDSILEKITTGEEMHTKISKSSGLPSFCGRS